MALKHENRVYFVGVLPDTANVREGKSGAKFCNFTLLTINKFQRDGEWASKKSFHKCVAFGERAVAMEDFSVGQEVEMRGRLDHSSYEKDGKKIYTTKVIVDEISAIKGEPKGMPAEPDHTKAESPDMFDENDVPF